MKIKNYMFIKLIVLITLVLFFMSFNPAAQATVMSNDEVARSVVQIAIELPDREPFRSMFDDLRLQVGTGMMIGDDPEGEFRYCVTAYHVTDTTWGRDLPEDMRFEPDEIDLYLVRGRDDYVRVSRYGPGMPDTDIQVLEVDPVHTLHGYIPLVFGDRSMYERGDSVTTIGFPAAAQALADLTTARFTDSSTPAGVVTRITSVDGVPVIQTDSNITGGYSGGPLINEDGVVIGITAFGVERRENGAVIRENVEYAVQVDELTDFLESRNIPHLRADETMLAPVDPEPAVDPELAELQPDEEVAAPITDQDPGQMMLYIGIGAAALLAVILAVVLTRGKKAAPVEAQTARASMPPPPSPAQTQKTSPPPTQAKPTAAAPVTRAKPVGTKVGIKGISGQFAGQTIEMVGNQLVIGRDPRMSQLVYPQSNDDISRKHVTIRFDEKTQKFILEDSSSNGTFLSSNEKLEPGKPYYLNEGDRFYVADSKEVFELTKE